MKTMTAGISAATLCSLMTAFAMVPLPTFDGSPTGLKLVYNITASKHIAEMTEWVASLDRVSDKKDDNGEDINAVQFRAYIHAGEKPKKYEFESVEEYHEEMENWREEKRELRQELRELNEERGELAESRQLLAEQTPIKKFWQHE